MLQAPQTWPLLCTVLLSRRVPSRQGKAPADEIIQGDGHREQPALWHEAQAPAWADYLCSSLAVRDETRSLGPCCSLQGFSSLPKWGGPNPERADCPLHFSPANASCCRALSICWWKAAEETAALLLHNICPHLFLEQELLSRPYHRQQQWTHSIIPRSLSNWCIKEQGLDLLHFHFSKKPPQKGYLPTKPPSSPKPSHSKTLQSPLVLFESSAIFLMIHWIQLFIYFPPNGTTFLYN